KRMCSRTSPRFFAASTISSNRSRTFSWPVNSLNIGGRREISNAVSGSGGFSGIVDAAIECWRSFTPLMHDSNTPLLQVLGEDQFSAASFQNVINPVESIAHQMKTESARFDRVMRAALHCVHRRFASVIAQAHPHAVTQSFHRQHDQLVV